MKELTAFWQACDRLASAAVMKEWELEVRDPEILAVGRHLLVETDQESASYPCIMSPRCGCSHEVFTHSDGTKVAVCTCDDHDCKTFPVEAEDLVVYELDFGRVLRALSTVMGFDSAAPNPSDAVQRIGESSPSPGCHTPVYFVRHAGVGALTAIIHDLALSESGPFILVTITPPRREPAVCQVADRRGVLLLSLDEMVLGKEDGSPGVDTRVKDVVDRFLRKAAAASVANTARSAYSDEVFIARNGYHTIILRGEELPPLSDLQADVVRILHNAALAGSPVMSYAEIACRIADLHAGDLGFEPPEKMSKVFRAGDPRSALIATTSRGYYRLSI